jgi:hypothetical protein
MRYLAVAFVCLAAGFGAGRIKFDLPFSRGPSASSKAHAVGDRFLGKLRVKSPTADSAGCSRRPASDDYLCTVTFGLSGSSADAFQTYVVREDGTYCVRDSST